MSKQEHRSAYKRKIAKNFGVAPDRVFLFWKGRVAMYALLKAYGIGSGDEVVVPAFTCVVVPNAVLYCNATPVYADVDPLTCNAEAPNVTSRISPRTKLVVAQNTYGLSPDMGPLLQTCTERRVPVIEDCTHGFGGTYQGKQNGMLSEASFFSTQWNKPYSTGIGGFAVVHNERLVPAMKALEERAINPTLSETLSLRMLMTANRMIPPQLYWPAVKTYRYLSKKNVTVGSSSGGELESASQPEGYFKGMSNFQAKVGAREIGNAGRYNEHRILLANFYTQALLELGITPPYAPSYATHTFLKYPLFVKNRGEFLAAAEKQNVELGDWFLSPIHPVTRNFERWQYPVGTNPVAEALGAHVVNLPTGPNVDRKQAERVIDFITRHRSQVFNRVQDLL